MEHTAAEPGAPVTVGYLGNFRHPWCTEVHVSASLQQLGHRVHRWQEDSTPWATIPALAERHGVQLVVWQRTWPAERAVVEPELARLRDAGVRSVSYHLDRWWGLNREHQVDEQGFFRTDLVVSPDDSPEWAAHGVNHLWMPPGVYGPECAPVAPNPRRYPHDVVFVGSHPYPHAEWEPTRTALIEAMADAFGPQFKVWPERSPEGRLGRPVRGRALQELYATARVVVGDSCLAGATHRYWSDRVPETLGRGGALVHPEAPGLDDWYATSVAERRAGWADLFTFPVGDTGEAIRLVALLLTDEPSRQALAMHGRATVLGRDLYTHRMVALLDHLHAHLPLREPAAPARGTQRRSSARQPAATPVSGVHGVRHRATRRPARFRLAEGVTDLEALHEVWTRDDYRLRPEQVRGKRVVDVGGNVGAFAVLAEYLGAAEVHTYEPHPDNRAALVANVAANRVGARVHVHPEAVYDAPGMVNLLGSGGGANVVGFTELSADGEVEVPMVECVEPEQVLWGAGYVKLDCEGAEYRILAACSDECLVSIERLTMEFHGPAMPHLAALDADGHHRERWGQMVARLADLGRVEVFGRPMVGGLLWWSRY